MNAVTEHPQSAGQVIALRMTSKPPSEEFHPVKASVVVQLQPMFVDKPTAAAFSSLSESLIEKMSADGDFPKPRRLSNGRTGYLVSELLEWGNNRPVSDLPPPKNCGYGRRGKKAA